MVLGDRNQYRKFAEQCRRQAGNCKMPGERDAWLKMAEEWQALAEHPPEMTGHISEKSKAEGD
jgi:hypothetical protein